MKVDILTTFAGLNSKFPWTETSSSIDTQSAYLKKIHYETISKCWQKISHPLPIFHFISFKYWSQKMKNLQKETKLVGKTHDINVVNLHRVKYISRFWSCMNEMVSWQPDGLITWGDDCLVLGHYVELFLHKYLDFIK